MSNGVITTTNPLPLVTLQQFAILFSQAATPVLQSAQQLAVDTIAVSQGQMSASTLNPLCIAFQAQYASLQPYFTELAARAAAGQ